MPHTHLVLRVGSHVFDVNGTGFGFVIGDTIGVVEYATQGTTDCIKYVCVVAGAVYSVAEEGAGDAESYEYEYGP